MLEWIDIKEQTPEPGNWYWTVERFDFMKKWGVSCEKGRYSPARTGLRLYYGPDGQNPWSIRAHSCIEVTHWLPVPPIPCVHGLGMP